MFITADMLVLHAFGDYILQSDWMANQKTKSSWPALAHVITYTLPFLVLTRSPAALAIILGTHFVIDRWRLARYICWAKNFLQPKGIPLYMKTWICGACKTPVEVKSTVERFIPTCAQCKDSSKMVCSIEGAPTMIRNYPWSECVGTGYYQDRPAFMAVWLMIICDNTMHVVLNGIALNYFG
jgi:hypothetical protein